LAIGLGKIVIKGFPTELFSITTFSMVITYESMIMELMTSAGAFLTTFDADDLGCHFGGSLWRICFSRRPYLALFIVMVSMLLPEFLSQ
jgi:hypothetical protein